MIAITDALGITCPNCAHTYVFFDGDHEPEHMNETGQFWGVCDKCLYCTPAYSTPRQLLEALNVQLPRR